MQNAREAADLVISLIVAVAKTREDDKLTISDALFFTPVISMIIPGVKGLASIPAELLIDADAEEELLAYIEEKLNFELPDDSVKDDLALRIFDVVLNLIFVADDIKKLRNKTAE